MIPALILLAILIIPYTGAKEKNPATGKANSYNLLSPDKTLILPERLREVSGVTILDSVTVALIEDEDGILFIYDLRGNGIKSQIVFAGYGDYEDIALVNRTIYVLRSDGALFAISDYASNGLKVSFFNTGVPSADNEGLCYDKMNDRLLIGCKGDIHKDQFKNKRAIYSFNLKTMKLLPEPVFVFDTESVNRFYNNNRVDTKGDKGKKDKKKEIGFRMSALSIHPVTGNLYLLSATDNILCVVNKSGSIDSIEELDKDMFLQPEGIAFFPNGDMLITNEARNKKPTLLRFNYLPGQ